MLSVTQILKNCFSIIENQNLNNEQTEKAIKYLLAFNAIYSANNKTVGELIEQIAEVKTFDDFAILKQELNYWDKSFEERTYDALNETITYILDK